MRSPLLYSAAKGKNVLARIFPEQLGLLQRWQSSISDAQQPFSAITEDYLIQTRARIFGNRIGDGNRSGAKLLKKRLALDKILNYYPESPAKLDPFFEHPDIEKRQIKLAKLRRRGKGPPKKGQGRRAKGKGKKK